ncbi:MAG: superoxide dismutase family protein [Acidobacteriota bacterium]
MRYGRGGTLALSLLLLSAPACGQAVERTQEKAGQEQYEAMATQPAPEQARAVIGPKSGSEVSGSATFTDHDGKVTLEIDLNSLSPGTHAVHIHAVGDCSSEDGKSAGGHWNPGGVDHGRWGTPPYHLGDLGNVVTDETGHATLSVTTDLWSVGGGASNDVVGKAIIVHAGADDFTSQPSGAAGPRVACGVIESVP